ncbi:ABC transporter ATP-binding protein [Halorarius halobius]|uniref:ABC transporter ATP-binding protein n=1 Tax=Halorarius halobius TaxID=2962671 RepID=UPI0020CC8647|nr:ABC transporter ATP-binding protein [Halorarius halobius]
MLEATHVEKHFGGLEVLTDLSLEVQDGEICGLIGPNGAGKTTFFNIVSGLLRANGGTITFNGEDITDTPPKDIARMGIGRTFQITRPYPTFTTTDNLLPGLLYSGGYRKVSEARTRARELIEFVGLEHKADMIGRDLTMSEKKRLEIAKGLATDPELLLLDEVFAGLSSSDVTELIELVEEIRDDMGVTVLLIEHVMEAAMNVCDRIMVLANGEIIANDRPEAIAQNQQVIDVYLGTGEESYA